MNRIYVLYLLRDGLSGVIMLFILLVFKFFGSRILVYVGNWVRLGRMARVLGIYSRGRGYRN